MWVYPNQVIANNNWTTNTGVGILLALGENDGLYVYNTSANNLLHLGMPQEVVNCELRVRGANSQGNPPLILNFYRSGNPIDSVSISITDQWVVHTLTVDRWDSVELIVDGSDEDAVDYLRAEPFVGLPTRRTLTGVGV
jgi:hypothetical protein